MSWTFTFRVTENSVTLTKPLSGADSNKHNSKLYRPQKQGPITHGRLQHSLSQRLQYRTFPGFSALRCFLCEIMVFSLSFLGERKIQVQRFNTTFQTLFLMLVLSQLNRSFSPWQTVFLLLLTLQILSQNVAITFEFALIIEHRQLWTKSLYFVFDSICVTYYVYNSAHTIIQTGPILIVLHFQWSSFAISLSRQIK